MPGGDRLDEEKRRRTKEWMAERRKIFAETQAEGLELGLSRKEANKLVYEKISEPSETGKGIAEALVTAGSAMTGGTVGAIAGGILGVTESVIGNLTDEGFSYRDARKRES